MFGDAVAMRIPCLSFDNHQNDMFRNVSGDAFATQGNMPAWRKKGLVRIVTGSRWTTVAAALSSHASNLAILSGA
jgi:hypothetical protein